MTNIKVYKSIAGDYFVLENNTNLFFYFTREDLPAIMKELIKLEYKVMERIEEESE